MVKYQVSYTFYVDKQGYNVHRVGGKMFRGGVVFVNGPDFD